MTEDRLDYEIKTPNEKIPQRKPDIIKGISVVGLGKLGLCIATCLAHKGYQVHGVDIDAEKVHLINSGIPPAFEPGLTEMLEGCKNRLTATNNYDVALRDSTLTFIVVNTPSNPDGSYSTEQLISASKEIGRALRNQDSFHIVVVTSTVLPGTIDTIVKPILEKESNKTCGLDFGLCYNPEFIALGSVIHNFLNPDFVLIGESDNRSGELLSMIYRKISENNPPIARMNPINAELTKIALNSYVTIKISFANTLAEICEHLPGGNVDVVSSALGMDRRIGPNYLKGGLGFGGPCFPRDNNAFSFFARQLGCRAILAEAADKVNEQQVGRIVRIIEETLDPKSEVAVLGLTYKPNTNIVEASQALEIAQTIAEKGYPVTVYDPLGIPNAKELLGSKVKYADSAEDCLKNAQACIITTPWSKFKKLELQNPPKGPSIIIDCWRILKREQIGSKAEYIEIGLTSKYNKQFNVLTMDRLIDNQDSRMITLEKS